MGARLSSLVGSPVAVEVALLEIRLVVPRSAGELNPGLFAAHARLIRVQVCLDCGFLASSDSPRYTAGVLGVAQVAAP